MDRVVDQFERWMTVATGSDPAVNVTVIDEATRINCHHDFTQREKHWGKDVWLFRKGAISAREGAIAA